MSARNSSKDRRRKLWALLGGVAILVLVIDIVTSGNPGGGSSTVPSTPLASSQQTAGKKRLVANTAQANQVIDGSIKAKISALRGVPVVVNQWASWCPNCREEFPIFQQLSKRFRGKVAFLGLDSQDDRGDAEEFLRQYPVIYPSIYDQSAAQAASIGGGQGWPTTIFYDSRGKRTYVREGGYTSAASLQTDIRRYSLAKPG